LPSELSHFCFVSSLVSFLFKFRPETISRILQLGNVEWYRAPDKSVKAIITPHAAYDNSGATAAFGFCQIDAQEIDRVFILGPSHYVHFNNCMLTGHEYYATPFGDLLIDT